MNWEENRSTRTWQVQDAQPKHVYLSRELATCLRPFSRMDSTEKVLKGLKSHSWRHTRASNSLWIFVEAVSYISARPFRTHLALTQIYTMAMQYRRRQRGLGDVPAYP